MRTIDLDSLDIFCAVVKEGGIVKASDVLHRVQSNVTTRIKQLESRLGVALFRRHGRTIALTQEGQVLLQYAHRLLRLADETDATLRAGRPCGTFRLGSLESTAGTRLPALLSRYHRSYPDVTIELATGTSTALVKRVHEFEIEAAFVSEPFSAPGLHARPVFDEELVLISTKDQRAITHPDDIGLCTLIAFANGCSYRKLLEEWIGRAKVMPVRVLEFASYQAIIACVAAGTGVAIVPRSVLATLRSAVDVRQHELPERYRKNRTHLIWHGTASAALNGLMEMLEQKPPSSVAAPTRKPALRLRAVAAGTPPAVSRRRGLL